MLGILLISEVPDPHEEQEKKLINRYLKQRSILPMTKTDKKQLMQQQRQQ